MDPRFQLAVRGNFSCLFYSHKLTPYSTFGDGPRAIQADYVGNTFKVDFVEDMGGFWVHNRGCIGNSDSLSESMGASVLSRQNGEELVQISDQKTWINRNNFRSDTCTFLGVSLLSTESRRTDP